MFTFVFRLSFFKITLLLCFITKVNGAGKVPSSDTLPFYVPHTFSIGAMKFVLSEETHQKVKQQAHDFLVTKSKNELATLAERQARYLPIIENTLREYQLPHELKYWAIVDTQYLQNALVEVPIFYVLGKDELVKKLNLTNNEYVDDRKHPKIMTQKIASIWQKDNHLYQNWLIVLLKFCLQENFEPYMHKNFPNSNEYTSKNLFVVNDKMPQPIIDYFVFRTLHGYFLTSYANPQLNTIQLPSYTNIFLKKLAKSYQIDLASLKTHNPWIIANRKLKLTAESELYLPQKLANLESPPCQHTLTTEQNIPPKATTTGFAKSDILMQPTQIEEGHPIQLVIDSITIDHPSSNHYNHSDAYPDIMPSQELTENSEPMPAQSTTPGKLPSQEQPVGILDEIPTLTPSENHMHKVVYGETLFGIARKYGVSVADLRQWNGMSPTQSAIAAGQVLYVKAPKATDMPPTLIARKHIVREGENLYQISKRYALPLENLMLWNNIPTYKQATLIKVGQVILLESTENHKQAQSKNGSPYTPHTLQRGNIDVQFYKQHVNHLQQHQLLYENEEDTEKIHKWTKKPLKNVQKFFKVSSTLPQK